MGSLFQGRGRNRPSEGGTLASCAFQTPSTSTGTHGSSPKVLLEASTEQDLRLTQDQ